MKNEKGSMRGAWRRASGRHILDLGIGLPCVPQVVCSVLWSLAIYGIVRQIAAVIPVGHWNGSWAGIAVVALAGWPWALVVYDCLLGRLLRNHRFTAGVLRLSAGGTLLLVVVVSNWLTMVPSHEGSFNAISSRARGALRSAWISLPTILNPRVWSGTVEEPKRYGDEVPTASTPYPLPPEAK